MSTVELGKRTNVRHHLPPFTTTALAALRWVGFVSPATAARGANLLWSTPHRHLRPQREEAVLRTGVPVRVPFGVGQLAAWTWGEGPLVLLVHGWEGRGSQLGSFVPPLVEAGYRVVAFDAPAHGDSEGRRASLFAFADALSAVVRTVGVPHAILAHSMGCAAALYQLRGGLPVERLVLVSPGDPSQAVRRFTRLTGLGPDVAEEMEAAMARRFGQSTGEISLDKLAAGVTADLLVVHDRDDRITPLLDGLRVVSAAPRARLVTTEGLGHHRVLRDAEVVAVAVDFLTGDTDFARAVAANRLGG